MYRFGHFLKVANLVENHVQIRWFVTNLPLEKSLTRFEVWRSEA